MFSKTNSLIVLCSFPQGYPGLLWELSWLGSSPADAFALGVVNVPEIIQRSSLPNLQHAHQIFTDGNQSISSMTSAVITYLKYTHTRPAFFACGLANYSRCWYADASQLSCIPKNVLWLQSKSCGTIENNFGSIYSNQSKPF